MENEKERAVAPVSAENIYHLNGRVPLGKAIPFGLQHVLGHVCSKSGPGIDRVQCCTGAGHRNHLTPAEITSLLQCAMFVAGIGTCLQLYPIWKIGSKLPIVMGEGVVGLSAQYWKRFLTPIVSACVVVAIGLSLLPVGMDSWGGGSGSESFGAWYHLLVGALTLIVCLVSRYL